MKEKQKKCDQRKKVLVGMEELTGAVIQRCSIRFFEKLCKIHRKYLRWCLFLMKLQASRPAPLSEIDSSKGVFQCICKDFKNIHFVEYLQMAASESVRYQMYIFLSEVCLQEEEEYNNYLRITPECFDELFVLVKGDITK